MKVKTSELQGAALDWAVAKCEGYPMGIWYDEEELPMIRDDEVPEWKPSINWAQGGPIIEREGIAIDCTRWDDRVDGWVATLPMTDEAKYEEPSPTPLVAAMRCYVASQLGDEVDVPDELLEEEVK